MHSTQTQEHSIAILDKLISFDTISSKSNIACIDYLADNLKQYASSLDVIYDDSGKKANLWARFGPEEEGGIILSGHSDVVPIEGQPWSTDPFIMTRDDNKLIGRGTADMKGFIACCLAIIGHYNLDKIRQPLYMSFTYDEETGCLGAAHLMNHLKKYNIKPKKAIIGEPTDMRIIDGHKGCNEYTTCFHGAAGHSSRPDLGVNAVEYAIKYANKLIELREDVKRNMVPGSPFAPPYTTLQIGGIKGGIAHNVIPDFCELEWDMRPINQQDCDYIKQEIHTYVNNVLLPDMRSVNAKADIILHILAEVIGLAPMSDNEAKDLIMCLTGQHDSDVVSFGTEAGLFQQYGVDVVVCGPGSIEQAHKANEFITIEQLQVCLEMLRNLEQHL